MANRLLGFIYTKALLFYLAWDHRSTQSAFDEPQKAFQQIRTINKVENCAAYPTVSYPKIRQTKALPVVPRRCAGCRRYRHLSAYAALSETMCQCTLFYEVKL